MRRFTSKDIGAELLPILTSGLYRDPFDAIREYTQNGIDAGATTIRIIIASNSVTILDNGRGMSPEIATRAIRLGMSDKNPRSQVGFRGIGIYSALHLCDRLQVRSRDSADNASVITIDFDLIRNLIASQEESRLKGDPATLWLEGVMGQAVTVGEDLDSPLTEHGTSVFMHKLSTDMGDRLKDRDKVSMYLQNAVPLPFSPNFRWREKIEDWLRERHHTTVAVELVHGGVSRALYRPYNDDAFTNKAGESPEFLEVTDPKTGTVFGHCWYCVNDANNVLPDRNLRGLLIKKFGFSVGSRSYAHQYFGRKVVADRITGELIVDFVELLPNAARDEFEAGPYRDGFFHALIQTTKDIAEHVDRLQNERKAKDVLKDALQFARSASDEVPSSSNDTQRLLNINVRSANRAQMVDVHRKLLRKLMPDQLAEFDQLRKLLDTRVSGLIQTKKAKRPTKVARILDTAKRDAGLADESQAPITKPPGSLLDVADQLGLAMAPQMQKFIVATDDQILKPHMTVEEYASALADLQEGLEDSL